MTNEEAILVRVSSRKYADRPLQEGEITLLEKGTENPSGSLNFLLTL